MEIYVDDPALKPSLGLACIVILTLFSGLRWETANDWGNYLEFFRFTRSVDYNPFDFEVGFRALVVACRWVGLGYTGFLLVSALISNAAFVYIFARLGPVAVLSVMYFCSYYLGYIGTQRQTLAGAFAGLALLAFFDGKRVRAVALVAVASLFHSSAVVCLLGLVVPRRSLPLRVLAAAGVVIGGLALAAGPIVSRLLEGAGLGGPVFGKLLSYVVKDGGLAPPIDNIFLGAIKRAMLGCLFAVACRDRFASLSNYILNLYLLSVALFFMFLAIIPLLALRIGLYFTFFENYLIYVTIVRLAQRYWREATTASLVLLSSLRLYWSITGYESALFVPYKSIFSYQDHSRFAY
ncbi:EpsG family protein [Polymorphobacter sp. PAMC 29334]|uniref:EpsG family protein n=1 Tax=Polymorphobacter sp. PAMC 29334 TaxID=2862331 RepID=UPI001C67F297|nr:EpsG family protein [Polymorphobacter sp. PAMC 29334]QYE35959.1 EpsG family protein [Polymorphobacter sp. PAMC 29334]